MPVWISEGRKSRTLKDLEVLEVGVFGVDIEFDARHRNIHYTEQAASVLASRNGGRAEKGGMVHFGGNSTENGIENLAERSSAKTLIS
jgi:hypothetical protein